MKIRSKEPYWLLKNGIMNSYPSLRHDRTCDVLVVGGGLTGALMAYQIASDGYKTLLIDRRNIGTGSTCATTSMIQYEIDEPLYALIETFGKTVAVDIYIESVNAIKKLQELVSGLPVDCEFSCKESLHFAETIQDAGKLKRELQCREMAGIKVKWLTKDHIASQYGVISEGGILSETSASLDAYQLTHALLNYTVNKFGAEVYDHTSLLSVKNSNGKNIAVLDTEAIIDCKFIVYATGYETHEFFRTDIGKLISTYVCVSEPIEKLPVSLSETIFWNTEDPYFYFRTTTDNRIIIGGEDENFQNPEKRDALIEKKEGDLLKKFQHRVPGINFIPDFSWAGTFGATKDALPYIGPHPDFPNSYFMLGFGGNGMSFSVMGMSIISDAMAGRPNKFLEYFKFKR